MTKFTKELRQQIVEDFARRHNGQYNPELFLKEVREGGTDHPAHSWFEWSNEKAAAEHRLWQARSFAKDLRIKFEVEEVGKGGAITVTTTEMPMVISPAAGRKDGGGYLLTDPSDPRHQAEHCHQAAAALRSWLNRYQAAVIHSGFGVRSVEALIEAMAKVEKPALEAAA